MNDLQSKVNTKQPMLVRIEFMNGKNQSFLIADRSLPDAKKFIMRHVEYGDRCNGDLSNRVMQAVVSRFGYRDGQSFAVMGDSFTIADEFHYVVVRGNAKTELQRA